MVSYILLEILEEEPTDQKKIKEIYLKSLEKGMGREELLSLSNGIDLELMEEKTSTYAKKKQNLSTTVRLWLLYMNYVGTMIEFFIAEQKY